MALIKCPKCGKEFSDRAQACPQCGTSKEEVQRIIKEQAEREAAERERIRKEREAKEAEEARIRVEKRAEWWKKNRKWIIASIVLFVFSFSSYIVYVNRNPIEAASAKELSSFRFRKTLHVIIPDSVTSIENFAFSDCSSLTSITIPNSVTSIGESAFSNCSSLTSIEIPNSVTSIGDHAFAGCSSLPVFNSIRYADSYLVKVVDKTLSSYFIKDGTIWIGSLAFADCTALATIKIPNSVTSIGASAFSHCTALTSIEIPNSVTSIEESTFYYCNGLTSVEIPNSVTSIGDWAFAGCKSLTSVDIPESVTCIKSFAFSDLSYITCRAATPPTINDLSFKDISKYIPVYVPAESVDAYRRFSKWCRFKNIQVIGDYYGTN